MTSVRQVALTYTRGDTIHLTGQADSTYNGQSDRSEQALKFNTALAIARAMRVKKALVASGVPVEAITMSAIVTNSVDASERKVNISLFN